MFPVLETRIAAGGAGAFVVFADASQARAATIDAEGNPTLVSFASPSLLYPADLIRTGSDFVAVSSYWNQGQRFSANGVAVGGPFPLADDPRAGSMTLVAGAPRLTVVYERPVRILPGVHEGAIRRVFFDFLAEQKRRAR